MKKPLKKVLVFTNDAGGSEIIAAYLKKHDTIKKVHAYVSGPGERIFRREGIPYQRVPKNKKGIVSLFEKHTDAELVLLGTGWMTKVESYALSCAKAIGLHTAVYLESWGNYRERFGYPKRTWKKELPDEIWVGDRYALAMAKDLFTSIKVRLVPNQYFVNIKERYKERKKVSLRPSELLFLSDAVPGTEQVLEELLEVVQKVGRHRTVRIRFHPADNRKRYDNLIKKFSDNIKVVRSSESDIVSDLLLAKAVIGIETVAMVPAVLTGKKTFSIIGRRKKSLLPFREIIRTSRVSDIAHFL